MRAMKSLFLSAVTVLVLAGCGTNDSAEGPGGVTASEARALNEAAAMLDARADNAIAAQADNALSGESDQ